MATKIEVAKTIETVVRPMTADNWAKIERAARIERSRAMAAMGRSLVGAIKRAIGLGRPITVWVPSVKGGRLTA
jgi:hypothetical protein